MQLRIATINQGKLHNTKIIYNTMPVLRLKSKNSSYFFYEFEVTFFLILGGTFSLNR